MSCSYSVVLLHSGMNQFKNDVASVVNQAADDFLGRSGVLRCCTALPQSNSEAHVVVAYLGNKSGQQDEHIRNALNRALKSHFPILPIVRRDDPGEIHEKLPSSISQVNAINWNDASARAVTTLLGMLGLVEKERRVFLSYVRRDSGLLAEQLHRLLVQSGFDVFLDRFAVSPGSDFGKQIDEELADKAFMVLLESPGLAKSKWVEYEIAYALRHRIGILAVTLPDARQPIPSIDDAFRIDLRPQDFSSNQLTASAGNKLIGEIEFAHARAIRRRREQMLGSLTERLEELGRAWTPIEPWTIQALSADSIPSIYRVTPRRPRPHDMYALDMLRARVTSSETASAWASVVHGSGYLDERKQALLDWIGRATQLAVKSIDTWTQEVAA